MNEESDHYRRIETKVKEIYFEMKPGAIIVT